MIKGRIRKLGYTKTFGQLLFMVLVAPIIENFSKKRIDQIKKKYRLNFSSIDPYINKNVESVNEKCVPEILNKFGPDVVLVNGTRIIKPHVFSCSSYKFINTHAGITPMYRGVHGGYWSLWNRDQGNFGATIHYIDAGVDTGSPLSFCRIKPSANDTFATYPLLQQAASLHPLKNIIRSISEFSEIPISSSNSSYSKQWYHPTIWEYFWGILRGVK